jgi:hypothetical protein
MSEMTETSLASRKDRARATVILEPDRREQIDFHTRAVRRNLYGRTEPRGEDLCAFDAMGMDIVEGRA